LSKLRAGRHLDFRGKKENQDVLVTRFERKRAFFKLCKTTQRAREDLRDGNWSIRESKKKSEFTKSPKSGKIVQEKPLEHLEEEKWERRQQLKQQAFICDFKDPDPTKGVTK
jgi:hypothetical protein